MSPFPITLRMLQQRLGTVARNSARSPDDITLFASIGEVRIPLDLLNFQIDDDGTLLFLKGFESFSPEQQRLKKRLLEALELLGRAAGYASAYPSIGGHTLNNEIVTFRHQVQQELDQNAQHAEEATHG